MTTNNDNDWTVFTPDTDRDIGNIEDVYEVCVGAVVAEPTERAQRARIIAVAPAAVAELRSLVGRWFNGEEKTFAFTVTDAVRIAAIVKRADGGV